MQLILVVNNLQNRLDALHNLRDALTADNLILSYEQDVPLLDGVLQNIQTSIDSLNVLIDEIKNTDTYIKEYEESYY